MPSSEPFMEKFTQDKKAFEQIPQTETFSIECIGTHALAESIINGNDTTEKRLDKIPKLLKNYKEVEAKLESNIKSVNSYIEDLQQLFLNSEGKEKEGYGKLMETALKTKKELVKLYGEFATAFASDAAKIGKESTFPGFFLTVYRTERMGLIDENRRKVSIKQFHLCLKLSLNQEEVLK